MTFTTTFTYKSNMHATKLRSRITTLLQELPSWASEYRRTRRTN